MRKPIKLPIFFNTDESLTLENVGIEYALKDKCEIKEVAFFSVYAVSPYVDENDKNIYCKIHTGESVFICTLSMEEVLTKLEYHNRV